MVIACAEKVSLSKFGAKQRYTLVRKALTIFPGLEAQSIKKGYLKLCSLALREWIHLRHALVSAPAVAPIDLSLAV